MDAAGLGFSSPSSTVNFLLFSAAAGAFSFRSMSAASDSGGTSIVRVVGVDFFFFAGWEDRGGSSFFVVSDGSVRSFTDGT